ncbi:MAG: hypothetical protein Q4Q37_05870 [Methanobrevibacter sp.]|nr:hypothetical protein [Methanobrevibacter sp.]
MKLKLAIIFSIVIWILTYALSSIFNPLFTDNIPHINIVIPIITIIVTGFFGILYIRTIETNEVIEGILFGLIVVIVDLILDVIFFVMPNTPNILFDNIQVHIISMTIITLLITTFLGYLAQMTIDLK